MRDYELVMVLSPEVEEEGVTAVVDRVSRFVTERGGNVTNQERWGTKKLAYPIKKFREGNYVLAHFAAEPSWAKELESSIRASEEVIRYLLVKREE